MAEKEKQPTREEQIRNNVKKTLEDKFIQDSIGSNNVKLNQFMYGQLGVQGGEATYDKVMNGEDAKKIKDEIYNQKKEQGKQLGVAGEPAYTTNYDVSMQLAQQVREVMSFGKLGDLESSIKPVAKDFKFNVPEQLKNYSAYELILKAQKGEELNKDEKMAMVSQEILYNAYVRGAALNASQSNYFADLNAQANEIMEAYKPKEENKK